MDNRLSRRSFIGTGAVVLTGSALHGHATKADGRVVRIGVIGTGNRGRSLLSTMQALENVEFPALCDINRDNIEQAQEILTAHERSRAEMYHDGDQAYEKLNERDDLDAVIIATPWNWHTRMAVDAMKKGKYVGVEVPAALTLDECWSLVDTSEATGKPCMMLENWSFRRDNLAVLNMVRNGLLGEMVHCHCAHSHDCVDHWFFDADGNMRWGGEFLLKRNCDQYPTHSLGPVLSWLDINCGDSFDTLTSTATDSRGINDYFVRKFGPDHPNAKRKYKQGDIVTSVVRTKKGRTIVINYDMQLPRPYDNRWTLQGTRGIYNEQRDSLYLLDRSPEYHQWEAFSPYMKEFDHPWYTDRRWQPSIGQGHGGTDYLELRLFVDAVRNEKQTPVDVYDSAVMSSVVALSEESIQGGSKSVKCPDFTRGEWERRVPVFAKTQ